MCHQLFLLIFRDPTLKNICKYTNKEGYYKLKDNWAPIETDELKEFIGTLLLIGVYESKGENISQLWSKSDDRPIFNKLFSRQYI